jgi:hypothetical protein
LQLQMDQNKNKNKPNVMVVVVAMRTTPPWQALMSCEYLDCTEMLMEITAWEHKNHNMIKKTIAIDNEEFNKDRHFYNHLEKMIHEWWIMGDDE